MKMINNTSSTPTTSIIQDSTNNIYSIIHHIMQFSILTSSVLGNLVLLVALLTFHTIKKLIDKLIFNLAICNLLMVLISIPTSVVISDTSPHYPFHSLGCKLIDPLGTYFSIAGVFTLIAIAFERWNVVSSPYVILPSKKKQFFMLFSVHFAAVIAVIPYFNTLNKSTIDGTSTCEESWNVRSRKSYTLILFFLQYGIPVPLMLYFYGKAWSIIRKANTNVLTSIINKTVEPHDRNRLSNREESAILIKSNRKISDGSEMSVNVSQTYSDSSLNVHNCTSNRSGRKYFDTLNSSFRYVFRKARKYLDTSINNEQTNEQRKRKTSVVTRRNISNCYLHHQGNVLSSSAPSSERLPLKKHSNSVTSQLKFIPTIEESTGFEESTCADQTTCSDEITCSDESTYIDGITCIDEPSCSNKTTGLDDMKQHLPSSSSDKISYFVSVEHTKSLTNNENDQLEESVLVGRRASKENEQSEERVRRRSKVSEVVRRVSVIISPSGGITIDNDNIQLIALRKRIAQSRDLLKMFTVVVLVFMIFMLPNQILWLIADFYQHGDEQFNYIIHDVAYMLTYANCVLNPWIYGRLNRRFKKDFRKVFRRISKLGRNKSNSDTSSLL